MNNRGFKVLIMALAILLFLPAGPGAFAGGASERYVMKQLPFDMRVFNANTSLYVNNMTVSGSIRVYQSQDAAVQKDLRFYYADRSFKPFAPLKVRYDGEEECWFQMKKYICLRYAFVLEPYYENFYAVAVYAASDTDLANPLAVTPIWLEENEGIYLARNASFKDENPYGGMVEGTLAWEPAENESRLAAYEVYLDYDKGVLAYVATVPAGAPVYRVKIPETLYYKHNRLTGFHIYSKGPDGEIANRYVTVQLEDNDTKGNKVELEGYGELNSVPIPASVREKPAPKAPSGKPPIRVFLHGEEVAFQTNPYISQNRTLVQFRPIFEKLGLVIQWDGKARKITGSKDGLELELTVGSRESTVNGQKVTLDAAPEIKSDYTFVPLRFVSEATGLEVIWDGNLPAVYIVDPATMGKLYYENGALAYEGQLKDGVMHGKGKFYRPDGTLWYDAEFVDGAPTGLGSVFFGISAIPGIPGEDYMIGEFYEGVPHGHAQYYNALGQLVFDGEYEYGERTYGKYYVNGYLLYEGEWEDMMFHGQGKMYRDGYLLYEGEFTEGERTGYGKYYHFSGYVKYEGQFEDGYLTGQGKSYYADGRLEFEGEFEKFAKVNGTEYYPNGKIKYTGTYKGGSPESGRLYLPDGTYYEGELCDEGEHLNYAPHGQGKWFSADGKLIFAGVFHEGIALDDKTIRAGNLE